MKNQMKIDSSDKVVVVTGAGGDIGREISLRFARQGATVGVIDINCEAANETKRIIDAEGGKAFVLQVEVSNSEQIQKMVQDIIRDYEKIDVLVNNAGIGVRSTLLETREDMWDLILKVDTGSVFRCTKYVAPEMIKRGGGRIINIASLMGMIGMGSPAYTAAKGGIIAMTPIVAAELGPHKINFNTICPGFIVTKLNRDMLQTDIGNQIIEKIPMRRFGSTDDTAALVSFLASDSAAYITGAVIPLDGGMGRFLDLGEAYRTYDPFKDLK
ncbi:MAG: SDR family oxidoreductase [Desulfobacteraceae bacterium]|nr:MAG: SDR family oxidoreductase [Desulfobacteraceae bacterium]